MTTGGWVVMIVAIGSMTGLLAWCMYKIIRTPESTRHLHSPLDIDTKDKE